MLPVRFGHRRRIPARLKRLMDEFAVSLKIPRQKKIVSPIIIGPAGPSRSGKSTAMDYMAKKLGLVHIQHDAMRIFLRAKKIDPEKVLQRYRLIFYVAERCLRKGHGVIIDVNFATDPIRINQAERLAKTYGGRFYLVRVKVPSKFMIAILKKLKYPDKRGLFPTARVAIDHFTRSSKQFDYRTLEKRAVAIVNSSKPLGPQLDPAIRKIKLDSIFV